MKRITRTAALFAGPVLLWTTSAPAQAPPSAPASAASGPSLEDRVVALVQAGKCGRAKAEATQGGDPSLADQVGAMCGARSSGGSGGSGAAAAARGGGGRGGGGGGRRSQGGAAGG